MQECLRWHAEAQAWDKCVNWYKQGLFLAGREITNKEINREEMRRVGERGEKKKPKKHAQLFPPFFFSEGSSSVSLQNDNPQDTAVVFKSVTIKNHYLCEIQQFGR